MHLETQTPKNQMEPLKIVTKGPMVSKKLETRQWISFGDA